MILREILRDRIESALVARYSIFLVVLVVLNMGSYILFKLLCVCFGFKQVWLITCLMLFLV